MIDKPLLGAVIALLTVSLIMDYSLTVFTVRFFDYTNEFHFVIRQAVAVFIGVAAIIVLSKLDPDKWFKPIGWTLFIAFFLVMIVMQGLPASLVKEVGGAKRWIHVGPISIAPVEFFKIGFIFFLSWSFSRKFRHHRKMRFVEEVKAFLPYLSIFALAVVIIAIFQKDLGQVMVLAGTLVVLFLFVGSSFRFFFSLVSLAVAGVVGLILIAPHRLARIKVWWITVQDTVLSLLPFESLQRLRVDGATKEPWQISHSLNAIHNGGLWGQGLGNGRFKLGYLSEVHTDFVLAGISEELGFLGLGVVVGLLLFVIFRIFKIAAKVENPMYYLFCVGVGTLLAFSSILNAYGISGMTPIKGIAVPFLSYGGSHIIAASVAVGMILMISKKVPRDIHGKML